MYCLYKKPKEYVIKIKKEIHIVRIPIEVLILEKKSTLALFFISIVVKKKANSIEDK